MIEDKIYLHKHLREHFDLYGSSVQLAPLAQPFECRDPSPILRLRLCVKASEAAGGEISLRC